MRTLKKVAVTNILTSLDPKLACSIRYFIMSICQFIVTLYFIVVYVSSSLIAPTKSQVESARPNGTNVTDIFYTVTHYRHLATLYRYVEVIEYKVCKFSASMAYVRHM